MDIFVYTLRNQTNYSNRFLKRTSATGREVDDVPSNVNEINFAFDYLTVGKNFFKKVLAAQELDEDIHCLTNYGRKRNHAEWDRSFIVLGKGDGRIFTDLAFGLDVVVHELTHAILSWSKRLTLGGQTRAVNEHLCDVIGLACHYDYFNVPYKKYDWLFGKNVMFKKEGISKYKALRDFSNQTKVYYGTNLTPDFKTLLEKVGRLGRASEYQMMAPLNHCFYLVADEISEDIIERLVPLWWKAAEGVKTNCTLNDFCQSLIKCANEPEFELGDQMQNALNVIRFDVLQAG